ncbi:MAG: hypothetical protein IKW67_03665 [Alphaproteobacteria bacterium]|nr:hypothetical protein [Alphaproteobacteria bacterium]
MSYKIEKSFRTIIVSCDKDPHFCGLRSFVYSYPERWNIYQTSTNTTNVISIHALGNVYQQAANAMEIHSVAQKICSECSKKCKQAVLQKTR